MSILLIAEHDNSNLKVFTLNTITAASKIDQEIHVLVAGNKCENVAKEVALISLVKKVIHCDSLNYENFLPENLAPLIIKISEPYTHIIAAANTFGKNFMPRVSALLDSSQISDVIKINSPEEFLRPIYAGNAFATVKSNDKKKCITIRPTSFEAASKSGGSSSIEKIEAVDIPNISKFIRREQIKSERPELGTARIVISGGRGMQSSDNFKLINSIADKLNAAVGASRAAVDAGYIGNDHQVGQTGKVVVPDLYIAVGISGAIQHLAGMKESKIIVAIHKDGEALPEFLDELNKLNTIQK
jgi:electron transfer flavoprotein alpha subunit